MTATPLNMNAVYRFAASVVVIVGLVYVLGNTEIVNAAPERASITIATGRVGGLYHPVGGAICELVNEKRKQHGIACTVKVTSGTVENIKDLRGGDFTLAMTQSDWQHDAVHGIGPFKNEGPFRSLRSVFATHVEHFTVVARADKRIRSFEDLKGRRVYLGRTGSGRRHTMGVLMRAHGWAPDAVIAVSEHTASNLANALCENEFDAFVYTIGHPNPIVSNAVTTCDTVLVPIAGPIIGKLIEEKPFYVGSEIPGGMYRGNSKDVPVPGLVATLVTSAETEPDVVYHIAEAFFENLDRLRKGSPVFSSLSENEMVEAGLTAPLHEGALRYFTEAGLK